MSVPPSLPPPRRYTSPTGRIVVPVLFVVLLIVVLGRPILVSGLDLESEPPDPVATSDGKGKPDTEGPTELTDRYPGRCLDRAPTPGIGLLAASDGRSVTAASPVGADAFRLQARPPIGFSASGRFLATAGADLWTERGAHVGIAFGRPVDTWAWSPAADCIAGVANGRLVVAEPNKRPVVLLEGVAVSTFSFSPDGSRMAFSVADDGGAAGIWLADLRSGEVRNLKRAPGFTLMGWALSMRPVLRSSPGSDHLDFLPADQAARCGKDIVTIQRDRVALLGPSGATDDIPADTGFGYEAVACAPDGDLLVVVRTPKQGGGPTSMVVLGRDGATVREVAQRSTLEDAPMWGPPGTGVVFAGDVAGEGAVGPLVWFLPEGGVANPTGLRVSRLGDELDATLDWSATPPLGHPTD